MPKKQADSSAMTDSMSNLSLALKAAAVALDAVTGPPDLPSADWRDKWNVATQKLSEVQRAFSAGAGAKCAMCGGYFRASDVFSVTLNFRERESWGSSEVSEFLHSYNYQAQRQFAACVPCGRVLHALNSDEG